MEEGYQLLEQKDESIDLLGDQLHEVRKRLSAVEQLVPTHILTPLPPYPNAPDELCYSTSNPFQPNVAPLWGSGGGSFTLGTNHGNGYGNGYGGGAGGGGGVGGVGGVGGGGAGQSVLGDMFEIQKTQPNLAMSKHSYSLPVTTHDLLENEPNLFQIKNPSYGTIVHKSPQGSANKLMSGIGIGKIVMKSPQRMNNNVMPQRKHNKNNNNNNNNSDSDNENMGKFHLQIPQQIHGILKKNKISKNNSDSKVQMVDELNNKNNNNNNNNSTNKRIPKPHRSNYELMSALRTLQTTKSAEKNKKLLQKNNNVNHQMLPHIQQKNQSQNFFDSTHKTQDRDIINHNRNLNVSDDNDDESETSDDSNNDIKQTKTQQYTQQNRNNQHQHLQQQQQPERTESLTSYSSLISNSDRPQIQIQNSHSHSPLPGMGHIEITPRVGGGGNKQQQQHGGYNDNNNEMTFVNDNNGNNNKYIKLRNTIAITPKTGNSNNNTNDMFLYEPTAAGQDRYNMFQRRRSSSASLGGSGLRYQDLLEVDNEEFDGNNSSNDNNKNMDEMFGFTYQIGSYKDNNIHSNDNYKNDNENVKNINQKNQKNQSNNNDKDNIKMKNRNLNNCDPNETDNRERDIEMQMEQTQRDNINTSMYSTISHLSTSLSPDIHATNKGKDWNSTNSWQS